MKTIATSVLAFAALASVSEGGIIFRNRSCGLGFGSCGASAAVATTYVERSQVTTGTTISGGYVSPPALGFGFGGRCSIVNGRMFCR